MGRNRRDRREPNKLTVHVTAQVFEGLPFVARTCINKQILGILARGQALYPVEIVAFILMGNHHHFIFAGTGNLISNYMNYIQGELARAFQRFIPIKYDDLFWADRFKEQKLVTPQDVMEQLIYMYSNPLEAGLVSDIKEYPGVSSIEAFLTNEIKAKLHYWTPIRHLTKLNNHYNEKEDIEMAKELFSKNEGLHELKINPYGWLSCFGMQSQREKVHEKLMKIFNEQVEKYKKMGLVIKGKESLRAQPLYKKHRPEKGERTPYLQCYDPLLRLMHIASYRKFCEDCRRAWKLLKKGFQCVWPLGGYRPSSGWRPLIQV